MLSRFLAFVVNQRLMVLTLTAILVGVGVWSAVRLPRSRAAKAPKTKQAPK